MGERLGGAIAALATAGAALLAAASPVQAQGSTTTSTPTTAPTTTAPPSTTTPTTAPTTTTTAPATTTTTTTLPKLLPAASYRIDAADGSVTLMAGSQPPVTGATYTWAISIPPQPGDPPPPEYYKHPITVALQPDPHDPHRFVIPAGALQNGQQYCIDLTVSASGYQSGSTDCRFDDPQKRGILTYQYTPPSQGGPGGGTPGGGTPGGGTPGGGSPSPGGGVPVAQPAPQIGGGGSSRIPTFFSPIRADVAQFAVGTKPLPTIQWLWRPEWFRPSPAQKLGAGDQPAQAHRKVPVEVDPNGDATTGASAMPWLAGLGAFGIGGLGAMAVKRRRGHAAIG